MSLLCWHMAWMLKVIIFVSDFLTGKLLVYKQMLLVIRSLYYHIPLLVTWLVQVLKVILLLLCSVPALPNVNVASSFSIMRTFNSPSKCLVLTSLKKKITTKLLSRSNCQIWQTTWFQTRVHFFSLIHFSSPLQQFHGRFTTALFLFLWSLPNNFPGDTYQMV